MSGFARDQWQARQRRRGFGLGGHGLQERLDLRIAADS
jgi:hypothetical protein